MTEFQYKEWYESKEFRGEYEKKCEDLGVTYTKESTTFKVWSPDADEIRVYLHATGLDHETGAADKGAYNFVKEDNGFWSAKVEGDLNGVYYSYVVTRGDREVECIDPYAKACGANGRRGMILDMSSTNPKGFEKDAGWYQKNKNTAIYELHIKDFSYDEHSGVAPEYRGKYMAFTQSNTTLDGAGKEKTCVSYLKDLGITHVHLLPTYDYCSIDETGDGKQFNWGYDPMNYNVPEGSYSTDAYHGDVRIREFKEMVQALHKAGIAVVMDVVYNHTFSTDSSFQALAPYYYYRQNEDGSMSDGSACGNETASERFMYRQFMIQSVVYWAKEYHIDGFRFDLMGLHDVETMNLIREALNELPNGEHIIMYGEPWTAAESPMEEGFQPAVKKNVDLLRDDIAIFCDLTRDAIKGSVFEAKEPGFVQGEEGLEEDIMSSVMAWCDGGHADYRPKTPSQIISYVSAHDNYTLWDKLALTMQEETDYSVKDERVLAANKLVAGIVMTCKGTPFFQAGEEFGRTKFGDENSYISSPDINKLEWKRSAEYKELVEYYKGLIAFRQNFAAFNDRSMYELNFIYPLCTKDGVVAYEMNNVHGHKDKWDSIVVVYNRNETPYEITLPDGKWQKLIDKESSYHWKQNCLFNAGKNAVKDTVSVEGLSIAVFGKKA